MTSDPRVPASESGWRLKSRTPLKSDILFFLTIQISNQTFYLKAVILGQLKPFIVGFDSMASDPWVDAQRSKSRTPYIPFRTDFLFLTLDFRVYDLGWGLRSEPRKSLKGYSIFLTYADNLRTLYWKAFMLEHLVPFIADFDSMVLDP